ncbi:hypothetical protein [Legionella yabuuchiae]|uniref:hypothetical protein n=1 Tax=Legionella yabuuchiae TaxID=376727 RepID=UPI0010561F98|nr:hypothetical protein [Legionella yabuuchiae]
MAKNAQFIEALNSMALENSEAKQALLDLMQADLSDGENFRTKVVEHYKTFGLEDDFIQDHSNGDDFLHFAGSGENYEENNFRALQRLAAEKYVSLHLRLLSNEALTALEESTEPNTTLNTLEHYIPELGRAYHFRGEDNDPPVLTIDALDGIRNQAAALKSSQQPGLMGNQEEEQFIEKFEVLLRQLGNIKVEQHNDVQRSLGALIQEVTSLRHSKSSQIPELCKVLNATINLFESNDKTLEEKVDEYKLLAQTVQGNPAKPLQQLSNLMFALGITILIAGIVLIPFAPLVAGAVTAGVGAGLMLFGTFYHPKQTGLARAMNTVADQIPEPFQELTDADYDSYNI